jgi:hypothetical protein
VEKVEKMHRLSSWLFRIIRAAIIGIVAGLFVNGCTHQFIRVDFHHKESDPELAEMVDTINRFTEGRMSMDTSKNRIGFKNNDEMHHEKDNIVAGTCNYVLPASYEIDINKETWKRASYLSKFLLVAHEMYHCVCKNIIHDDSEDLIGCPKSYFHPSMPPVVCLQHNYERYLKQVEQGCEL